MMLVTDSEIGWVKSLETGSKGPNFFLLQVVNVTFECAGGDHVIQQ